MRFALVQFPAGLDVAGNLKTISQMLDEIKDVDVIVLPEASMRDFGEDDLSQSAQSLEGAFVTGLRELAKKHAAVLIAGMFEAADPLPFNTVVAVDENKLLAAYRKIHLYDSFGYLESERLQAGPIAPTVFSLNEVKIGIMTCYDLRFPEHARMLVDAGADVLVVPAAWVAGPNKVQHWMTLLTARAIENTIPVLAAAQNGSRYSGHTSAITADGTIVGQVKNESAVIVVDIDLDQTSQIRLENPSLANRRIRPLQ